MKQESFILESIQVTNISALKKKLKTRQIIEINIVENRLVNITL